MTTHNTIGKGNAERAINGGADEFFTDRGVARDLMATLKPFLPEGNVCFIEPSAGDGAFVEACAYTGQKLACDLTPRAEGILKANFLRITPKGNQPIVVYGNPPFGFAASLAVRFFNHAAKFADVIAFVLPKSFMKDSVQARLHRRFHLAYQQELTREQSTFRLTDGVKFVPCVWQIWVRRKHDRPVNDVKVAGNPFVDFVAPERAEFCVRRIGGRAGKVLRGSNYSRSTTYFLRAKQNWVRSALERADFSHIVNLTAGVRSLSKRELVASLQGMANGS